MKIGFDVSQTGSTKAGCGFFANELISQLARIDDHSQYILYKTFGDHFWDPDMDAMVAIKQPNFQEKSMHKNLDAAKVFWRQYPVNMADQLGHPDLIHANNFFCPAKKLDGIKLVYTLYDLSFINHPEYTTEANRLACFEGVLKASMTADVIIAISEYSRADFLRIFPHYPAEKIKVIYPASRFTGLEECNQPKKHAALRSESFWLSVGTIEPRKNHYRLLEAYAELKAHSLTHFPLVLVGNPGWMMDDFSKKIDSLGLQTDVILWGYANNEELAWLYRHCYAFLYPSLFEGFGLPVLEAMTLGAPVVTANVSSIPEVVGNAGMLINPQQVSELVSAMRTLLQNEEQRIKLKQLAMERAQQFSWRAAAQSVLQVYTDVMNGS